MAEHLIRVGDFIIIKKHNHMKLHKFKQNGSVSFGKDNINLSEIEGYPFFSAFKLIPVGSKKKREFNLEICSKVIDLKDEIEVKSSGTDNRNIQDDGRSQKLSAAEIEELKLDANKASNIVESLICNSNTFHAKTEYSQEKYLSKKGKKYFEYIQVLKPNLRMITEVMHNLDSNKVQMLRVDTLSQILAQANIYSDGTFLLYDSGSNGLLATAILCSVGAGTTGKVIHMHPGNMSQKQALLAMNFPEEQMIRCISVNIYSVLRQYYQQTDVNTPPTDENTLKRKSEFENGSAKKRKFTNEVTEDGAESCEQVTREPKKPKWHFDNITASNLIQDKVDSLIIACKEDPENIFNELVVFLKPGKPFVIFYSVAEPLLQLYTKLKTQSSVAALKLTNNWMRKYQVLPERTHPEVMMDSASGFILSGVLLK